MRILRERWKGLARLACVELAELPTPVERHPALGREAWVKRDDLTGRPYGGNKVRKLEWLLGDASARGCDCIVTTGAIGSHHVLATALYGARHGFEVHAVLYPQSWNEHVEENVRADLEAGAVLYGGRSYAAIAAKMAAIAARLRMRGRRPYVLGPGGSSPVGTIGYVEAGLELAQQIAEGAMPEPDAIYVAAGSGGTAAGLAVGLAAAGITTPLVAVRVTDRLAINRALLGHLARRAVTILRREDDRFPSVGRVAMRQVRIDGSQLGAGYGAPTAAAAEAQEVARADGLLVDPTYTSKTLAALLADVRSGAVKRPLFWLTLSSAPMAPLLVGAPAPAEWITTLAATARV